MATIFYKLIFRVIFEKEAYDIDNFYKLIYYKLVIFQMIHLHT